MSAARDLLAGWRAQRARATAPKAVETEVPEHADATEALAERDIPSDAGGLVGNDSEREAMAAYYGGELSAPSYRPTDRDELRDGLRISALMRPSSWADPTPPTRVCWCSCCSTPQAGGRWWRPRHPRTDGTALGPGWRCMTCHPPPAGSEVEEVRT
jgi:hypothetical protein